MKILLSKRGQILVATFLLTVSAIAQVEGSGSAEGDHVESNNPAANPTQRDETWLASHLKRDANMKSGECDILLIGDSITHGWRRESDLLAEVFPGQKIINLGQPADKTENILWRLKNHSLNHIRPKVAVILAGTNNTNGDEYTAVQIAGGVREIVAEVRERLPTSKVLLLGIFPRGSGDQRREIREGRTVAEMNPQWEKIDQVNDLLSGFADGESVVYLNINAHFLDATGKLPTEVMPDLLHLNTAGYQIWGSAMGPALAELLPVSVPNDQRSIDGDLEGE